MEIKIEAIIDTIASDGSFSIRKQQYIDLDGHRNYLGLPERRSFNPGDFEGVSEYAPEFENVVNAMWTPDIIAAWQDKVSLNDAST